ncbi:hypothetical protein ASPCADRAFT_126625 [Aspergillus carbonarius ITEM 5010]|uniref:Actin cortical patch SUR7/pH-response regulator PalI n=1 Tax=Aspergillus carbonarius (strain ITEM 5010) TaxID=602072 RepID=A0A1R3RZ10_ASPC5|nr:hypothetical protein ASPCADRAFT_126625 [Aspergillus carbonarius ITEM 5010]
MSRLVNYFPTITAFIAFILSLLCLFAGTQLTVLPGANILTVFTSNRSQNTGIHNFYSIYVMSYCEGDLMSGNKRFMNCSKASLPFAFDPSAVLLEETGNTTSLSNLGWPDTITDDFHAFGMTSRSMGPFYCIGAGVAGLAIVGRLWWTIRRGPRQSVVELVLLLSGFAMLGISSIIATVIAFQFVGLVNDHGRDTDVSAEYGPQFLGMTWAATGLLLGGSITSLVMVLIDRSRSDLATPADDPVDETKSDQVSVKSSAGPSDADAETEKDGNH